MLSSWVSYGLSWSGSSHLLQQKCSLCQFLPSACVKVLANISCEERKGKIKFECAWG